MNAYVNKKDVSEFLREEIKTISKRWGRFKINVIALEKEQENWGPISDKDVAFHKKLKEQIKSKTAEEQTKALNKLSNRNKEIFVEVDKRKNKEAALSDAKKGLVEFEEFLEVATNLKHEIDVELSTSTT